MPQTDTGFRFFGCSELREIFGEEADDEKRLVELLESVPLRFDLLSYAQSYFLRHSYVERVYPNDFAQWVAMEVRDHVLGERLAVVDSIEFSGLEALRGELISIIDDHLSSTPIVPRVIFGEPFHFNNHRILEVPTGPGGADAARVSGRAGRGGRERHLLPSSSKRRYRFKREESDFSALGTSIASVCRSLADRLRAINPVLWGVSSGCVLSC